MPSCSAYRHGPTPISYWIWSTSAANSLLAPTVIGASSTRMLTATPATSPTLCRGAGGDVVQVVRQQGNESSTCRTGALRRTFVRPERSDDAVGRV